MSMNFQNLEFEIQGQVPTVWLNRPSAAQEWAGATIGVVVDEQPVSRNRMDEGRFGATFPSSGFWPDVGPVFLEIIASMTKLEPSLGCPVWSKQIG